MQKLVIASGNAGKIKEIEHYLKDFSIEILSQKQLNIQEVPETGSTFVENALIKAKHAAKTTDLPALADDSGLVIKALNGEPGIYSARYAGADGNAQANLEKVLANMKEIKSGERQAYFYCCMVLLQSTDDPAPLIATGIWQGRLLTESQGEQGFGYDPIFYVPTHQCSAAELDLTEKNNISHRGLALQQLRQQLHESIRTS